MRKFFHVTAIAMMLIVLSMQFAFAGDEEKTVKVIGEGVIFNNDEALAEEKAVESALRTAVEQVVGVYVKSDTMVQNYITIDDRILSQSKGYVKTYKKLSSKKEDGVIIVEVEATVLAAKLKGSLDELQAALAKQDYPRLMLFISEQNVGETSFSDWWGNTTSVISMGQVENSMIELLSPKGFTFVDPQVLAGKVQIKDAYKVAAGGISNQGAREIANLTNAEIIVVGTAVATDAGTIMGTKMHSGQADITVKVINTDNGEILFTASAHGTDQHVVPSTAGKGALVSATKKIAEQITVKITEKWLQSTSTISLHVAGISSYQMLDDFKKVLAHQLGGIKGVQVRTMEKDKAQIDVFSNSKTEILAKELTAKSFAGFVVRVDGASANKLTLTLIKK